MLAFVIRQTMLCLMPRESVKVVSQYAARRLCHGFLKELHVTLVTSQEKQHLERWCLERGKAIHPPSQYFGHRLSLHTGEDGEGKTTRIELTARRGLRSSCKDFHLAKLAKLDEYLQNNGAELYLSPSAFESERGVVGNLCGKEAAPSAAVTDKVRRLANQAVKLRKRAFEPEEDDFWDAQQSALTEAIDRVIAKTEPGQLRAYLDAVNTPLRVLRQVRFPHGCARSLQPTHHEGQRFPGTVPDSSRGDAWEHRARLRAPP